MISWKLEITENETRLVVQDGAVMSSDILSLARHLVNKYFPFIGTMSPFLLI